MGNIIQSIPEAKLLLASLRSVGYTEETAIADIVDNCISAKAKHIDIIFETEKMRILILDDGIGMTAQALIENMRIGSSDPSKQRDDTDLGRFGMGMKTAAFSLGKRLTVVTRLEGTTSNATWDLDKIPEIGWNLIIEESDLIAEISFRLGAQGTVVCIENLDRVIDSLDEAKAKKKFYKTAEKVEKHLALIFHRFIEEDGLVIRINGTEIQPWNPFVINNNATQELADETVWSDDGVSEVVIQPYVLPHRTKFASDDDYQAAGGAKGWNYHQGVYVYRNRRLIICGTWFDYIKKEPAYNLARIKVDISSVSDEEWKIDIKKSTASLPGYVRDTVERAIDICTEASARVYTDVARTQNTIYLRLNYDEPSGTVVNVRKSMWIHPTQDRAISVREAARLQTFPDSFVFCGSKDKQYQQVGNAVPPIMAKSIAEKLAQILEKNLAGRERNG